MRALPILLVTLAACPSEAPAPEDVTPPVAAEVPAAEPEVPVVAVREFMGDHYEQGRAARDALMGGDLVALQAAAGWIAGHEAPAHPDTWAPHLQEMRTAAQRAARASELGTAAEAVAVMGAACGACHAAHGTHMAVAVPEPPPAGEGVKKHMARHEWAAEQMWLGLAAPSDDAWTQGAAALTDPAPEYPEGQTEAAAAFHALAPKAATAADGAARATAYGEVIATCAGCHPVPGPAEPAQGDEAEPTG